MSATLLYRDPFFQQHETGNHVESPDRIVAVNAAIADTDLADRCDDVEWTEASEESLLRVHTPEYLARLEAFTRDGGGRIEQDTVVSPHSYHVARRAAGAACDAVSRVCGGKAKNAFCLLRPPGHHALADGAMGFCLLNHAAIAAAHARDAEGVRRVLIVDWDVHHGNGTQDIFYRDPDVAFFSAHRWPFYPGSGRTEETGSGPGLGTTRNLPLPFGIAADDYLEKFRQSLETIAAKQRPELIVLSAGFDAHHADPVGSLGLCEDDFSTLSRCVLDVAAVHCQGRVVSLLEGGYNPQALGACVKIHLESLVSDQT
ncbi:MAG: histone deacetylase [Planctomycetota bacterium]|nr:histone deacetylase [Planctomycetota bacterium]